MSEWQPIETAPKDGTSILLRSPQGRIADGEWGRYGAWTWPYVMVEPTEWRPLPIDKRPCGECHLKPGERCNICGALEGK